MALSSAAKLEQELLEKVSLLSPAQKRETLDFVEFIATQRRRSPDRRRATMRNNVRGSLDALVGSVPAVCPLDAIIGCVTECNDTDLSINHDKYLYGDDQS